MKALIQSDVGRKRRKQEFRKLWICRVNAVGQNVGLTYSALKNLFKKASINLNLKMLAQLAILDKNAFLCVLQTVKQ